MRTAPSQSALMGNREVGRKRGKSVGQSKVSWLFLKTGADQNISLPWDDPVKGKRWASKERQ